MSLATSPGTEIVNIHSCLLGVQTDLRPCKGMKRPLCSWPRLLISEIHLVQARSPIMSIMIPNPVRHM